MKMEEFTRFTSKCFNGEPASCSFACPFHLDIRSFLKKSGDGRWTAAYKELANAVVFPSIVSILCEQPCRECCQRSVTGDAAIAIRDIEAAVIKYVKSRKPAAYVIPPKIKSIAVVGAGISGLSCALNLAQKNYPVTVFEKKAGWGGHLRDHPRYQEFNEDIALQFSSVNVTFQFETEINFLNELNIFDAVYIATGSDGDSFGLLESWDPELLTTSESKVFMGGALCGASMMAGIAQGRELSKSIETFLQTGKAGTHGGYEKNSCGHFLEHRGAESASLIKASSGDGYTEEEAKQEAARCFLCDCDLCLVECEMLKSFRKSPHKMAVEAYTDLQASVLSSRLMTRETYSCNICGYCESICPERVSLGDMLQLSRGTRFNTATYPAAFHDFWLREMDFHSSEAFFALPPKGKETCEYAFFPGCQLGASNPEYVYKAFEFLQNKYNAGIIHDCCGAPAYWAGDEARLKINLDKIAEIWNTMGKPTLIFACATCESIFGKFLPQIGSRSLYGLLAEADEIEPIPLFQEAAVFDPCAARENPGMEHGVRRLADKAGIALQEFQEQNRCCGYGGHMRIANPSLYDEITQTRAAAAEEPYLVYCVNCREVFASRDKRCAHILDVVFGLAEQSDIPTLQEKRDNSLGVKKEFMKEMAEIDFEPVTHEWDELELVVSDEIQKSMEKKLISASDIKEAIWLAEATGDQFLDETDGTILCSMVKSVLTYWVQYRVFKPGTYEILSAYNHRMRFREGE